MRVFIRLVKILAFIIAMSVWCTVGLAVWIALVCRVTAVATFRITATLIASSGHGSIESATDSIESAAAMWCRGAIAIASSFFLKEKNQQAGTALGGSGLNWKRVLQEFVFSALFYGSIFALYGGLSVFNDFSAFDQLVKNGIIAILSSWTFWVLGLLAFLMLAMLLRHAAHDKKNE